MLRPLAIALALTVIPAAASADPALDAEELEFLRLINAYRAKHGAPCLSPSPTMNEAADYLSRVMGEQGFFSHNEPPCDEDGDNCTGRDPFDRIDAFGHVGWSWAGENIAAGSMSAAEAFEAWRNSKGHDENMRQPNFTAIGIARVVVPGSRFRVYWTTDFSDHVDGPWNCEGRVDGEPEENEGGASGGGGCSAGGSAGGLLGVLGIAGALALGRRRA